MKKTLLLIVLAITMVGCLALAACQPKETPVSERTITGVVSDDSGAVENAEVTVRSTEFKATTDAEGKFEIKLSKEFSGEAQYSLVIKKAGYLDKTETVKAEDFKDNAADVKVTVLTEKLTIKGTVKNGEEAIDGVSVSVSSENTTTTTNDRGEYSLVIDRPVEAFTVVFLKDYFVKVEKTLSDFDVTTYTLDVNLSEADYSVRGAVEHYFTGALKDVNVSVKGQSYSAVTDSEGKYEISGIKNVNLPYTLVFSKDGYQTKEISVSQDNANIDAELISDKIDLGRLSVSNKNYSMQTVRDSKGLYFYFSSAECFVNGNKICIYIDVNESGRATAGSTVLEFALEGSDAGQGICVLWNQKTNEPATAHATINWGSEVKYNLINDEAAGSKIEAFISYETFAKLGEDFKIDKNSVVGLSFFDRSAGASGAAGWDRPDMPGYDKNAWVHPDNPKDFARFSPENVIYEADNNAYVPYGDYTVNITVEDEDGNKLEGANVNMTYPLIANKTTGAEGVVIHVLNGVKFAQTPVFGVSLLGYFDQTLTVARSQFDGKTANVTVTLIKADESILNEHGTVIGYNGVLGGVTVEVEGYESKGSVTTDSQGKYDLAPLGIDLGGASTYKLKLSKQDYESKTVEITAGVPFGSIYMETEGDLGVFGQYQWNTRLSRDENKLTVYLTSSRNWYGKKDLNGNETVTENELQIYFVKDLTSTEKTAESLFELTVVEKADRGEANWAGWRDGKRDFLAWPDGIVFDIANDENGCRVRIEVSYAVLGIGSNDTIGLGLGEWYGPETPLWTCPFYDGATQSFVSGGWAVNANNPSTCLHWKSDNSTEVA